MSLAAAEVLRLHREIVAIPSVSGREGALADFLGDRFAGWGWEVRRLDRTLLLRTGRGPVVLFDTHLDTVPPGPGWTADPFQARRREGRVYGLGANDAKAAVAAMVAAFAAARELPLPFTLVLALVQEEETSGGGTERVLAHLAAAGLRPAAAVIGEPTGLDLAVAQKGLLVLRLRTTGRAVHAALAAALEAPNAVRLLARDLVALEGAALPPPHPRLGPITVEPTRIEGGTARNVLPAEAACILDVRTVPGVSPGEITKRLRRRLSHAALEVVSDRLAPRETPPDGPLLRAARRARPTARLYGSPTLSDWALLGPEVPALKCGPGRSERSHRPDEYVLEEEILAGAAFYEALLRALAEEEL